MLSLVYINTQCKGQRMYKALFPPPGVYIPAKETNMQSTHNAITAICENMPQLLGRTL